jgi:CheY-like chemotaxis protein
MFERYTERARRVIFFARYEASEHGASSIETEHLLLGILREGKEPVSHIVARGHLRLEAIRREIERRLAADPQVKVSTSVDIPLSAESKRVLVRAAEEAERMHHDYIGTEHILIGLLQEESSFAARILTDMGVRLSSVREDLALWLKERRQARTVVVKDAMRFEVDVEGTLSVYGASAKDVDAIPFDGVPATARTLLVADQDDAFRMLVAAPLVAKGFTIWEACDGGVAWNMAVKDRPSLILAESRLIEMDGFEFCRRVRAHASISRTPFVLASKADNFEDRQRGLQVGADDFLSKHLSLRELMLRIRLVLERYADAPRLGLTEQDKH